MKATGHDLLKAIDNALFDLQSASFQSYERPLRVLGRLLRHEDLKACNSKLTLGLDLHAFLRDSERTQRGMVGSARLLWPEEPKSTLGLMLLLVEHFADSPDRLLDFAHTFCCSGGDLNDDLRSVTRQIIVPFVRDYRTYVLAKGADEPRLAREYKRRIFIVHGRDEAARESVARYVEKLSFEAVILHEIASGGRTLIEKVEANSDVGFAVVLLTGDDEGRIKGSDTLRLRARQNVMLELGYFIGKLGRDRVCVLHVGGLELPSDIDGIVWVPLDLEGGWRIKLGRELKAAGFTIDWDAVIG